MTGAAATDRVRPAPGGDRHGPAAGPNGALRGPAVGLHTGWGRAVRGTVAGTGCAGLSLALHTAGGGAVPGAGAVLLAAVVASGAATWWADRRRGPAAFVLLTAGLQAVLHMLFGLLAGHESPVPGVAMTAAHALAALGVAWLLLRGEDALWDLCGALTRAVAPVRAAGCPAVTPLPVPHSAPATPRGVLLARVRPRRGPPLLSMV